MTVHDLLRKAKEERAKSDARANMVSKEQFIRRLNAGKFQARDRREQYWCDLTEKQMLQQLYSEYARLELWEDAARIAEEIDSMKRRKKPGSNAREVNNVKVDKHKFVQTEPGNGIDLEYVNPQYVNAKQAKEIGVSLCRAELDAIVTHDPTLFEEKALTIKPFYLLGKTPEQTSSELTRTKKKGFSLSIVKYYFSLFRDHSETHPPEQ